MAEEVAFQEEVSPVEKDRHLLVAVDGSESSEKAVLYVADFLGDTPGFRVTLFHVLGETPDEEEAAPDGGTERGEEEGKARAELERYRTILAEAGFPPEKVEAVVIPGGGKPVAEMIMKGQAELGSCTIVIGRRRKSRKEEFLFGSVSSRLVKQARMCSVWVVE